jgi:phage-related protein
MAMQVHYYTTSGRRQPVADFMARLPPKTQAAILTALERIEDWGLEAPGVGFRKIRGQLWEIRIRSATALLTALERVED